MQDEGGFLCEGDKKGERERGKGRRRETNLREFWISKRAPKFKRKRKC